MARGLSLPDSVYLFWAWYRFPPRSLSILCQLAFDQALRAVQWRPDLGDFEADWLNQLVPLSLGALFGCQVHHHHEIQGCCLPVGPRIRDDVLVDQHLTVSRSHSRNQLGQDLLAGLVIPVMENRVEKVHASAWSYG